MLKKVGVVVIFIFLIIFIVFGYNFFSMRQHPYNKSMEANWSIMLPDGYECVYSLNEDTNGILGDGDRYHILQYYDEPSFDKEISWDEELHHLNEAINVLENLKVDISPEDFTQKDLQYHFQEKGNNKLWMIYDGNSKTLHIIERIM